MIPVCNQYNVSLIPYSPLAGGHLTHLNWETDTTRSKTDNTLRKKYDSAKDNDLQIIKRVNQLAQKNNVSMVQISLAWLYKKGVASQLLELLKLITLKMMLKQ